MRVIQVSPMGGLGNRMIQYMAALALAARVTDAHVACIHLPEWGIQIAPCPSDPARTHVVLDPLMDLPALASLLERGEADCVDIRTYAQRMENFLPAEAYGNVFRAPGTAVQGGGTDEILCNIRQGEILDARHPDYVLIPLDFYAEIFDRTGLRPVFCGQLDESSYLDALMRRFPDARYVPSEGAILDFERIRRSRHIVPAISTFSWLAAWLSQAERIFMPVLGLFHPLQSPATNLLPLDDPRFSFTLFPFHYAVPVSQWHDAHASLRGLWRQLPAARLRQVLAARSPDEPPMAELAAACMDAFDEAFYLGTNPDVAAAVAGGTFPAGRDHYAQFGLGERRQPCAMDNGWYCRTYPVAALELGQGDWRDPLHHYLDIGRARGYRAAPGHGVEFHSGRKGRQGEEAVLF